MTKGNPGNVGQSDTRRGEHIRQKEGKESGRVDTGTKGQSQRPTGKSTPRDLTGVDPEDTLESDDGNAGR